MGDAYDEMVRLLTHPPYAEWRDPNPSRSRVTAQQHALQAATRAERSYATDEAIICALVHDAARPLSEVYHGEVIAEIMRGKVSDDLCEALRHHGVFQSDIIHKTNDAKRFAWLPWYPIGTDLARWDAASFDPHYDAYSLDHFLPRLADILNR